MDSSGPRQQTNGGIPAGRGPYDVACGDVMTNSTQPGLFMRVYYPLNWSVYGTRPADQPPWLPGDRYAKGYARIGGFRKAGGLVMRMLEKHRLPVKLNGELSLSRAKYPVVIFSHGLAGCRTTYASTCIDVASCGCVVAAPEHRENSACYTYDVTDEVISEGAGAAESGKASLDQRTTTDIEFIKAPYETHELRTRQIKQRRDECLAAFRFLRDINEGQDVQNILGTDFKLRQFQGRLDLEEVAVCGHSFGASTAMATLSGKTQAFKCGVVCDPWGYPLSLGEGFKDIRPPLLVINTEKFQDRTNIGPLLFLTPNPWATTGPRRMITIRGTNHMSQSDLGLVFPSGLARVLGLRHSLHPRVAMAINNDAMINFLSEYIKLELSDEMRQFDATRHPRVSIGYTISMEPTRCCACLAPQRPPRKVGTEQIAWGKAEKQNDGAGS